ncbi:MAG: UrcA family protein [Alphaproteobacteria bacterium]|nr:UrcA family protein [Alphaproteobacteria bacterium]
MQFTLVEQSRAPVEPGATAPNRAPRVLSTPDPTGTTHPKETCHDPVSKLEPRHPDRRVGCVAGRDRPRRARQERVGNLRSLNLTSEDGRAVLQRRIDQAAKLSCGGEPTAAIRLQRAYQDCIKTAKSGAAQHVQTAIAAANKETSVAQATN